MTLLALTLFTSAARAECTDPAGPIAAAEQAVLDVKLTAARDALAQAQAALGCSAPARPDQLAHMWLAEAVLAQIEGRSDRAKEAFVAAWRASPELWVDGYGQPMQAARNQAVLELGARPPGTLTLSPQPRVWTVWLDGRAVTPPLSIPAGLHLVQLAPEGGAASFAKSFVQPSGDALTITVDVAEPSPEPGGAQPPEPGGAQPPELASQPPPPRDQVPDPERVQAASTELQQRASDAWGLIDTETRGTSARAERRLRRYLDRYEGATVRVDGVDIPIEITQAREARARLDALPEARAREAALAADEKALEDSLKAPVSFTPGLDGVSLSVAGAALRARSGELDVWPAGFGGLGTSVGLSGGVRLLPRVRIVGGLSETSTFARPEDTVLQDEYGWGVEDPGTTVHVGTLSLGLRLEDRGFSLSAGPCFQFGTATGMSPMQMTVVADGVSSSHYINAGFRGPVTIGGVGLSTRYLRPTARRVQMGPELSLQVGSDSSRLYTTATLGLTLYRPRTAESP